MVLVLITTSLKPKTSFAQPEYAMAKLTIRQDSQTRNIGFRSEPIISAGDRTNRKATLKWKGLDENVSHYVIERSVDGETFSDAGMLFTADDQKQKDYSYTDKFRSGYSGRVWYRLKVVYVEGGAEYSPVTILPGY
jgi:hypothetical protein